MYATNYVFPVILAFGNVLSLVGFNDGRTIRFYLSHSSCQYRSIDLLKTHIQQRGLHVLFG